MVSEDVHHPALCISLNIPITSLAKRFPVNSNLRLRFSRANFPALYEDLFNADWSSLNNSDDVNEAVHCFYEILYNILNKCVPTIQSKPSSLPPWFDRLIINNLNMKNYYHRKWIMFDSLRFYEDFSRVRNLTKQQISTAYRWYINGIQDNIKSYPKGLWQYVNMGRLILLLYLSSYGN